MSSGFSPQAQVRPTTAIEVLSAVVAKIQATVPLLGNESTCFISDTPEASAEVQDNLFATVSMGSGQFDQGIMDGAGNMGVAELSTVMVTVFSRIEVDQIEHFSRGLTDPERGLLTLKQQILKALAGKNLDGGLFNGFGSLLLMEHLGPRQAIHPGSRNRDDMASFSLAFDAKFSWNLQSDSEIF